MSRNKSGATGLHGVPFCYDTVSPSVKHLIRDRWILVESFCPFAYSLTPFFCPFRRAIGGRRRPSTVATLFNRRRVSTTNLSDFKVGTVKSLYSWSSDVYESRQTVISDEDASGFSFLKAGVVVPSTLLSNMAAGITCH